MTLQEFTEAANQAADNLFITTEEAQAAIERYRNEQPTHWMPLPEPPEVESNGQH
jgi:hypothetical protein